MATENKQEPAQEARNASPDGEFIRDTNYIEDRIVPGISEPTEQEDGTFHWPQEAGRYRLAVARACPWAHRTVIARRLMGLEDTISLALAGPTHDVRSWQFDLDEGVDPVLQIHVCKTLTLSASLITPWNYGSSDRGGIHWSCSHQRLPFYQRDFITSWKDFQRGRTGSCPHSTPKRWRRSTTSSNPSTTVSTAVALQVRKKL